MTTKCIYMHYRLLDEVVIKTRIHLFTNKKHLPQHFLFYLPFFKNSIYLQFIITVIFMHFVAGFDLHLMENSTASTTIFPYGVITVQRISGAKCPSVGHSDSDHLKRPFEGPPLHLFSLEGPYKWCHGRFLFEVLHIDSCHVWIHSLCII